MKIMSENTEQEWTVMDQQNVDGIELTISYSALQHQFRVAVKMGDNEFQATHKPVFGMDISDSQQAYMLAESLAQELEAGGPA